MPVPPLPLSIALLFFVAALAQHVFGVAIYIYPFARLFGEQIIMTKEENPEKFARTIAFQFFIGCFFVLLQLFDWYVL